MDRITQLKQTTSRPKPQDDESNKQVDSQGVSTERLGAPGNLIGDTPSTSAAQAGWMSPPQSIFDLPPYVPSPPQPSLASYGSYAYSPLQPPLYDPYQDRTHKCRYCDRTFAHESSKCRHEKEHFNSFPCPEPGCDVVSSRKDSLKRHLRLMHGTESVLNGSSRRGGKSTLSDDVAGSESDILKHSLETSIQPKDQPRTNNELLATEEKRQTADTAAKRSKEIKKSKRDVASDSGYSSHTAATGSSFFKESKDISASKDGLLHHSRKMAGVAKKSQAKESPPPPKAHAKKPLRKMQKDDNPQFNQTETGTGAARIKLSNASVEISGSGEVYQHPFSDQGARSSDKLALARPSMSRPILIQKSAEGQVRGSLTARPASYHAEYVPPQTYISSTPQVYHQSHQAPLPLTPFTLYPAEPPPYRAPGTTFVKSSLPGSKNREISYPFPPTSPQWHPQGYHAHSLSSSQDTVPLSRRHPASVAPSAAPAVEYPSVPMTYHTKAHSSPADTIRQQSTSAYKIPVVPSLIDDKAIFLDDDDEDAYHRRRILPPPIPQKPKMLRSANTSAAISKRTNRKSVDGLYIQNPESVSTESRKIPSSPDHGNDFGDLEEQVTRSNNIQFHEVSSKHGASGTKTELRSLTNEEIANTMRPSDALDVKHVSLTPQSSSDSSSNKNSADPGGIIGKANEGHGSQLAATPRSGSLATVTSLASINKGPEYSTQRLSWQCPCGFKSHDDFTELQPGALAKMSAVLKTSTQNQSHNSSYSFNLEVLGQWAHGLFKKGNIEKRPAELPQHTNGVDQVPAAANEPVASGSGLLYILLSLPYCSRGSKLWQPHLRNITSDHDFFELLKTSYGATQGRFKRFASLKTVRTIKFVQLEMFRSRLVDIRKWNDVPPETDKEYMYDPKPPDLIPPVGENLMMHLLAHPDHADGFDGVLLRRIPKKSNVLYASPVKGTGLGWGIHFSEGWNTSLLWICFLILALLGSIVFLVCWAVLEHDVQGASGVAAYVVALITAIGGGLQAGIEMELF